MNPAPNGTLYLVPTPIGNLEDMTHRAVRILSEVDHILAEDTRQSRKLLDHYGIQGKLFSHHKFNEKASGQEILRLLQLGKNIAMISDAGTPLISDPGSHLVNASIEAGIRVEALPGANAVLPALLLSGFPTDRFCFEGFLPHKKGRMKRIEALLDETRPMIFYESPHRIIKALTQFTEVFGPERRCSVSREISKKFEETRRGTLQELILSFEQRPPKGEFVIVLGGKA